MGVFSSKISDKSWRRWVYKRLQNFTEQVGGVTQIPGGLKTDHVQFPVTQIASSDVNTLDDYEEGTFTPTITFGGGSTGITYSLQNGSYTKIGDTVVIRLHVNLTSKGSSTGDALILGLPFTTGATFRTSASLSALVLAFTDWPHVRVDPSTASMNIFESNNAGTRTALTDADFADTTGLTFNLSYKV